MGVAGPTDVLSFPLDSLDDGERASTGSPCCSATSSCARRSPRPRRPITRGTVDDELALLVVHGILHVLGHDHAEPGETPRCANASAYC